MSTGFGSAPVFALLALGLLTIVLVSFLSAVEISVSRLSRAYVADLADEGVKHAPQLDALLADRSRLVLSLRSARVAAQTLAIVTMTVAFVDLGSDARLPWWLTTLLALLVIGAIELLAVTLFPWAMAGRHYAKVALLGTPLAGVLVGGARRLHPVAKRFRRGDQLPPDARLAVADDLRELADEVGEPASIDDDDKEMLRSVFELGQTMVREVMVPRTSMIAIGADETLDDALSLFIRSGFSRVPVVGDDIDDVYGILYFKDVVRRSHEHPDARDSSISSLVRSAEFIPEMRLVDDELRAMQADNVHLALAVDEYGGIAGLVTMEDLLEELVGELTDEHDRHEMAPEEVSPGVWRVPSRYPLADLSELVGREIEEDAVDSVGGLLAMALGQVPLAGAQAQAHGLHMRAENPEGRRRQVGSVLVQIAAEE